MAVGSIHYASTIPISQPSLTPLPLLSPPPPVAVGSIRYALRITGLEPESSFAVLDANRMHAQVAMAIIEVPLGE